MVLVICFVVAQTVVASPEIMPLDKVKPGMKGVGKTVVSGTEVEDFKVEVVSTIQDKADHPLILIKTSGQVIDKTGGIASGMSGSPVYIDGKLIGAVGYGWQMANHKIGMVTPIESMLDIFKLDKLDQNPEDIRLDKPIKLGNKEYDKLKFGFGEEAADTTLVAKPATTPLVVNGLEGRARDRLATELDNYDLAPVKGGGVQSRDENVTLEPGSAVAVQLVRGDINVSSIGTLTYRDQDQLLAFGHPFLSTGNVDYLLSAAYIHQMVTSVKMPFKIGSPLDLKGIITQDRSAGLAGTIDKYPNVIPVEIKVTDKDLQRKQNYNFQIVEEEDLLPKLSTAALLQAIDSTLDRKGGGTAKVQLEIMGNHLPDNLIKHQNFYYSKQDIASTSLSSLVNLLQLIIDNPFQEVDISGIKVDIEVEEKAKVALVEEITLDKTEVQPGDEVEATVTLRRYREDTIDKQISLQIPEEVEAKQLELHALSGREANLDHFTQSQSENRSKQISQIQSLEKLIETYQDQNQNNQLLLELRSSYATQSESALQEKQTNQSLVKEELNTEYVLKGAVKEQIKVTTSQQNEQSSADK